MSQILIPYYHFHTKKKKNPNNSYEVKPAKIISKWREIVLSETSFYPFTVTRQME